MLIVTFIYLLLKQISKVGLRICEESNVKINFATILFSSLLSVSCNKQKLKIGVYKITKQIYRRSIQSFRLDLYFQINFTCFDKKRNNGKKCC